VFGTFRILLIDDDEDDFVNIRDLFSEIPRSTYKVTWKSSYKEGLSALCEQEFDACLLDYRLGEKTGLDLLNEANKFGLRCPMIFLTGHGDFELDLKAMQIGAADYLVKGQLNAPILERSVRYSMKQALDMGELRETKAQVLQQDRLASLGLLASSLAHEIGTPLGIIRSRAELAEKRATGNDLLKQDMGVVILQIDRITKLVNSLLHLARAPQSDVATAVDLNQVVQDVMNLVQHELDRKNIALKVEIQDDVKVKAEAGPLGQVLLNLLVNSVHAIEEARKRNGSVEHHVRLSIETQAESVIIFVQDTGCGIPAENLSQLFKPFFTTKDIGQGTGLGLATSYKLVQSWGGSISAESQSGKGTTFIVSLTKVH
jgi:signal transduction histidine kinase